MVSKTKTLGILPVSDVLVYGLTDEPTKMQMKVSDEGLR